MITSDKAPERFTDDIPSVEVEPDAKTAASGDGKEKSDKQDDEEE